MNRLLPALFALLTPFAASLAQQNDAVEVPYDDTLPPGTAAHVQKALDDSPRHGEWVDVPLADGKQLETWVVYPERADKAGVVLVIHDIRGMSDWVRAVGDQLAQDGFVAVVPDFLSGMGPDGGGTASLGRDVGKTIRQLDEATVNARLDAAKDYATKLAAANGKVAVLGFCWGGTQSFGYALHQQQLDAAVVFYGNVPGSTAESAPGERIAKIAAPVLGLYGGNDARIGATLPPTIVSMMEHKKSYAFHSFEGAGHGFVGRQDGQGGANLAATKAAWMLTLAFLRRHLG
ncbi:MAG: dienelactone hydrolase family protein [Planctomycetota bacterium]